MRTISRTDERAPEIDPSMITLDAPFWSWETALGASGPEMDSFAIGSVGLVREFVEHMVATGASAELGKRSIDWEAVEASVADARSYEHAIGRAVVIADQMCRGVFHDSGNVDAPSPPIEQDPFFAFSMAHVVPDFGRRSRYRTRMAKNVARLFGSRRTAS